MPGFEEPFFTGANASSKKPSGKKYERLGNPSRPIAKRGHSS